MKYSIDQFRLMYITQGRNVKSTKQEIASVLRGGCRWVQLRMKEAPLRDVEEVANWALPYVLEYDAILIVNDYPVVALHSNAHGVHLGQLDVFLSDARSMLGDGKIIGATVNNIHDLTRVLPHGPDYFGIGPFQWTSTKKKLSPVLGYLGYAALIDELVRMNVQVPFTAVGGITQRDLDGLANLGIKSIAVSGAISNSDNIEQAARLFSASWLQTLGVLHKSKS